MIILFENENNPFTIISSLVGVCVSEMSDLNF